MIEVTEHDEFIAERCRRADGIALSFPEETSQSSTSDDASNDSNISGREEYDLLRETFDRSDHSNTSCSSIDDMTCKKDVKNDDDTGSTTTSTVDLSEPVHDAKQPFNRVNDLTLNDANTPSKESINTDDEEINHELSLHCIEFEGVQLPESSSVSEPSFPTIRHLSLFDQLDIMFEKLCFADTVCHDEVMTSVCATKPITGQSYDLSMETIVSMLGCINPPSANEFDYFASLESYLLPCWGSNSTVMTSLASKENNTNEKLRRRGRTEKRRVIQQLLLERGRTSSNSVNQLSSFHLRRTRSSSSIRNEFTYRQQQQRQLHLIKDTSSSFDILAQFILPTQTPISTSSSHLLQIDATDGYDSDPCLPYSKQLKKRPISPRSILVDTRQHQLSQWNGNKYWYDTNALRETVELSMNSTWDLLWIHDNKPILVHVWIERGAVLKNRSTMIEPCLMWRAMTSSSSSTTTMTPTSIRLLQICRVRPLITGGLGIKPTNVPTMCRASTSLMLRTIHHDTVYFQASTIQERDSILHQWKVTIARLATLAVLEDNAALIDEFFLYQRNHHEFHV